MLLTSADTKSLSKHEEISGSNNSNESPPPHDETTRSSSADNDLTTAAPDQRSAPASPAQEANFRSANERTSASEPIASGEAKQQLTQLNVTAEENFAFKSYINAQTDDDDETMLSEKSASPHQPKVQQPTDEPLLLKSNNQSASLVELRLLVRRREAGALIGKKGANIKRLRDNFRSSTLSIPDTGNGPERVVCLTSDPKSMDPILADIARLLVEKSPENDEQVELKLLIHSSHAGSIIGIGGQSIKKLRNESKAAIKIYEMCCPLSNERVCAIKARPPIVVSTIKLIQTILRENPIKGTIKPYDALHFDLSLVDKYGGYLPEEPIELFAHNSHTYAAAKVQESSSSRSKFRSAASRFHPYAGATCHQTQIYSSQRASNGRHPVSSALHHPPTFQAAALAAAVGGQPPPQHNPRAPYAQLAGHPLNHFCGPRANITRAMASQLLYSNCHCLLMPMVGHESQQTAAMLAAYAQVAALDSGEECHQNQTTNELQLRKEPTNSSNGAASSSSKNN